MPIDPTTAQSWLFVPPLDLPLTLRVENGRFGALRRAPLAEPPPCATGQVIPADDPFNPTGAEVHYVNQLHEAVDLAASAGDCVFAALPVVVVLGRRRDHAGPTRGLGTAVRDDASQETA